MCLVPVCLVTLENLNQMFPDLHVRPRPRPDPAAGADYEAWLREYEQWGSLRCPCNRGYFCREHGSWVSGPEVGSGAAPGADQQSDGSCPSYHYGDYKDVTSYIGARDGVVAKAS